MTEDKPRVEALLQAMTLEEKIGQLTMLDAGGVTTGSGRASDLNTSVRAGRAGSLLNLVDPVQIRAMQRIAIQESRLRIPLLFGLDVVHGHHTTFPIPLAEAAAFDPDLWRRTAEAAAAEAAADGINLTFAPMLDIARDPRWGRIAESPGEDVLVARRFAQAKVNGFQGRNPAAPGSLAATAKHLAAYGAVAAGREYAPVDISERLLHEVYLPPFHEAVRAGVAVIMPAFTDLAGVPMSANVTVLRDLVRQQWGFDGVFVSDYSAIQELINHGVAEDLAAAAALALRAGIDIDMMGGAYEHGLSIALKRGAARIEDVDAAVGRVLALKARLGLFHAPDKGDTFKATDPHLRQMNRSLARDAARRSIVLLKNERSLLPLDPEMKRIALIGPLINARSDMLGPWSALGDPEHAATVLDGLRSALPIAQITAIEAMDIEGQDREGIRAAVDAAAAADAVVLCLGEDRSMSGEASSRAHMDLPGRQRDLAEAILVLRKPVIAVIMSGRPLVIGWLVERADAVIAAGFLGHEAGHALADVITGHWNPSGRLPVSWPHAVGQIPIFYAQRPTGRPRDPENHFTSKYLDMPNDPLFRFGDGLSYTSFAIAALRANATTLGPKDEIVVDVEVRNEGSREGEETIFLFIHDPVASVSRPILELKDFAKIELAAGETGTVRLRVAVEDLKHLDADLRPVLEAGVVEVLIGPSADRARLHQITVEIVAEAPIS
ncbi:glycoside hydrolase family 3 N-terminal domain-containing protein [Microvirga alba]|uniref:Glycoside hydrolase family 3 C-terminal domain-containing protein n=1 Tax=Microvirga alba TaxID=2791025 RepID=A0A931BXC0_9HYPH|nr:glycoside hydrolase family 3 N-terminal domain-containing protein [Microvirga alba]MBF9234542.1 glycoside hydrolase family 3 C-terminal domain-containing protein [Microvirga alba]